MAKKIKFGNVILCEYAAEGSRKKHTLVNVYSGDIVVKAMPAQFNLGLYMEILPLEVAAEIEIELVLNGEVKSKLGAYLEGAKKDNLGLVVLPSFRIRAEHDSIFEVYVIAGGYKRTAALRKKIFKGDVPDT